MFESERHCRYDQCYLSQHAHVCMFDVSEEYCCWFEGGIWHGIAWHQVGGGLGGKYKPYWSQTE